MMLHFTFPSYDHAADFAKAVPFSAQHEGHDVAVFIADDERQTAARQMAGFIAGKYFGLEVTK